MEEFKCENCGKFVAHSNYMGTKNRNHCPFCLWSKHMDLIESGDRKAGCKGKMKPIGLTFKQIGKPGKGEAMLIHQCLDCGKISINRIAGDDNSETILKLFEGSFNLPDDLKKTIIESGIKILTKEDKQELRTQLFGK
jgi:hypothetical protein